VHPILFTIGDSPVTAYGLALSLAFAAGVITARYRARAQGLESEVVTEVSIVILIASLLGSRLLYAYENPGLFMPPTGAWANLVSPLLKTGSPGDLAGLSMSGGVVLAALAALSFLRLRGASPLRYADALAPSVALGAGITRIGCFLNGCCHGVVCSAPWGVVFPAGTPAANALGSLAVHPTQLYASLAGFVGFGVLVCFARTRVARERVGMTFFAFLFWTSATRMWIDQLRHYGGADWLVSGWKPHEPLVMSLLVASLCGVAWLYARKPAPRGAR
jgi:phosphatidylglycerol:prolipoprotein diacylglycerol transferase